MKTSWRGKYKFNIPGNRAPRSSIWIDHRDLGRLRRLGGRGVATPGTITATLGHRRPRGRQRLHARFYGDRLITLAVTDQIASQYRCEDRPAVKSLVSNEGNIHASGGASSYRAGGARVVDSVINNTGVIEADTIGTRKRMIGWGAATETSKPTGAPVQTVEYRGKISAAGKGKRKRPAGTFV